MPNEAQPIPVVSWFKAHRSQEALELIKANPSAFVLLYMIAYRARWHDGFNADCLTPGEAMLGDFESYGMSERQYRTAKGQLEKWKFATFKTTNKGTIGKIIDTRVFSVLNAPADGRNDMQAPGDRRTADGRPTTNLEGIEGLKGKEGGSKAAPRLANAAGWQITKDRKALKEQIREAKESAKPDEALIRGLTAELAKINQELRRRGSNRPATGTKTTADVCTAKSISVAPPGRPKRVDIHTDMTPEQLADWTRKFKEAANGTTPTQATTTIKSEP